MPAASGVSCSGGARTDPTWPIPQPHHGRDRKVPGLAFKDGSATAGLSRVCDAAPGGCTAHRRQYTRGDPRQAHRQVQVVECRYVRRSAGRGAGSQRRGRSGRLGRREIGVTLRTQRVAGPRSWFHCRYSRVALTPSTMAKGATQLSASACSRRLSYSPNTPSGDARVSSASDGRVDHFESWRPFEVTRGQVALLHRGIKPASSDMRRHRMTNDCKRIG